MTTTTNSSILAKALDPATSDEEAKSCLMMLRKKGYKPNPPQTRSHKELAVEYNDLLKSSQIIARSYIDNLEDIKLLRQKIRKLESTKSKNIENILYFVGAFCAGFLAVLLIMLSF